MKVIDIIKDYEEFINNLILGGCNYKHSIDEDFVKRLIKDSKNYQLDYGLALVEELMNLYHREQYGEDIGNEEKSATLAKLITYIENTKRELKKHILTNSLDRWREDE